jgi:TonB family protein
MRKACLALGFFVLASSALAQSPVMRASSSTIEPGDFDFSGAMLRISPPSPSGRQVCSVTTVNNGAWIAVSGDRAAMITTMNDREIDYERPASLQLGDAPAFAVQTARAPHFLAVPLSRMSAVVLALYTQQRVHLRFVEWPDGGMFDEDLKAGDFAAAYDRAVQLCAWPRLSAAAVHPTPGPEEIASANAERAARASVSVSGADCIYCPAPVYPDDAIAASLSGSVVLKISLTPDGRAAEVSVLKQPSEGLGAVAAKVAREWRFRPSESGAAGSVTSVKVVFRID